MRIYIALIVASLALVVTLSSCMTPRQADAAQLITEAVGEGRLSLEEGQQLLDALDPSFWAGDLWNMLGGGGFGFALTHYVRNKQRKRRGEPTGFGPAKAKKG